MKTFKTCATAYFSIFLTSFSFISKASAVIEVLNTDKIVSQKLSIKRCDIVEELTKESFSLAKIEKERGEIILSYGMGLDSRYRERSFSISLPNINKGKNFILLNPTIESADSYSKRFFSRGSPISVSSEDDIIQIRFFLPIDRNQLTSISLASILGDSPNRSYFQGSPSNPRLNSSMLLSTMRSSLPNSSWESLVNSVNGKSYSELVEIYNQKAREEYKREKDFMEQIKLMCSGGNSDYIGITYFGEKIETDSSIQPRPNIGSGNSLKQ